MSAVVWKPGETCRFRGQWATVNYLVSRDQAIITTDDQSQLTVPLAELTSPVVRVTSHADGPTRRGYGGKYGS